MKVKQLMKSGVITVSLDDPLSAALGKMKSNRVHQLPVLQNGLLQGLVELKSIVTKNIDVQTAKVDAVRTSCTTVSPSDDVADALRKFIQSGARALPVIDNNRLVGIISEADFLRVPELLDKKKPIESVMTECFAVERRDKLGRIKKMMLYNNISRVPVIDAGKLVGAIGTLDLIPALMFDRLSEGRGGPHKKNIAKEKIVAEDIAADALMRQPKTVDARLSLEKAAELLVQHDELYIEKDGKIYVVTPKDLLETAPQEEKGVFVDIVSIGDEDAYTVEKMHQAAAETVQKIGKYVAGLESLIIRIERMHKAGTKMKYSVRARFFTPLGLFVAHAWGWDLLSVTQQCLHKMETEIKKATDKRQDRHRQTRQKTRL